jgi:hypothetical protein
VRLFTAIVQVGPPQKAHGLLSTGAGPSREVKGLRAVELGGALGVRLHLGCTGTVDGGNDEQAQQEDNQQHRRQQQ